jgi:hypothetical protein
MIGDHLSSNQADISEHIVEFYKKLFTEQCRWRLKVDGIAFESISEVEAGWLERDFEEEEVRKVVSKMNGNKASGPKGFSMAFFQVCWDAVRMDIMKVFGALHAGGGLKRASMPHSFHLFRRFQGRLSSKTSTRLALWEVFAKSLPRC